MDGENKKEKRRDSVISCGIIPFSKKKDGRFVFLLVHQTNGDWSFPKGHLEGNEECISCAKREYEEELGVSFDGYIFFQHSFSYSFFLPNSVEKKVILFPAYISFRETFLPQQDEIKEVRWFSKEEVIKFLPYKEQKDLFRHFLSLRFLFD